MLNFKGSQLVVFLLATLLTNDHIHLSFSYLIDDLHIRNRCIMIMDFMRW